MNEVNVNTPGEGPEPGERGTFYGFIAGVLVAIVIVALLVYLLLLSPAGTNTPTGTGGGSPAAGVTGAPAASVWHLGDLA